MSNPIIKQRQNRARIKQLEAQETYSLLKKDKRLKILIGTAILAELHALTSTDREAYQSKMNQLRDTLNEYTSRQRDKEFLMEFDSIVSDKHIS